jgi:hypothetical protein
MGMYPILNLTRLLLNQINVVFSATPCTVSTIEALLRDKSQELLPHNDNKSTKLVIEDIENQNFSAANEVRLCGFCGKMFASSAFLEGHISRRHHGDTNRIERKAKTLPSVSDNFSEKNKSNKSDDVVAMNQVLEKVEKTLRAHKESLKSLAQEETEKIKGLYGQLNMENELMDDIRNSRLQAQHQLDEAAQRLDRVLQEKEEAVKELEEIKEQIQLLNIRKKMEANKWTSDIHEVDVTAEIEIKRLENALRMSNKSLAISQQETRVAEAKQVQTIQEKNMLEDEITQLKSQLKRYEAIMQERIPPEMKDLSTQTLLSVSNVHEMEIQTDARVEEPIQVKSKVEIGVQTDNAITSLDDPQVAVQNTSPVKVTNAADASSISVEPVIHEVVLSQTPVVEKQDSALQEVYISQLFDRIQMKAENAARDVFTAFDSESEVRNKTFISLPKRPYLCSRYQHEEEAIANQIEHVMDRLNHVCKRYGVLPSSTSLSENHMQIVQQVLHAHLEILPTEVLNKMIDQEKLVNEFITVEWLPMEEARQRALEELKLAAQEKSEKNQQLILQAMDTMNSPESIKKRACSTFQKCPTKSKQSEQEGSSTLVGSVYSKPPSFASLTVSVAKSRSSSMSASELPSENDQSAPNSKSETKIEMQHVSKPSSFLVKKIVVSKKESVSSSSETSAVSNVKDTEPDSNSSSSVNVMLHEIPNSIIQSNTSSLPRIVDIHTTRNDLEKAKFEEEIVLPLEASTETLDRTPLQILQKDTEKIQGATLAEIDEKGSTQKLPQSSDGISEGIDQDSRAKEKNVEEHRPSTSFSDLSPVRKFSSIGGTNDLKEIFHETSSSGDGGIQQTGHISLDQVISYDDKGEFFLY